MIRQCRKAGHPYFNEDGSLNTNNCRINPAGGPVCKACLRTGGPVGRPASPYCARHGLKRIAASGRKYCAECANSTSIAKIELEARGEPVAGILMTPEERERALAGKLDL